MTQPANPNSYVSVNSIRVADDLEIREVDVPEWGGKVRIRQMTADKMTEFYEDNFDLTAGGATLTDRRFMTKLVAQTLVDENDAPFFGDDDGPAILSDKSFAVISRLANVAIEINRLDEETVAVAKKD